jgi:STE24 endopeptidase
VGWAVVAALALVWICAFLITVPDGWRLGTGWPAVPARDLFTETQLERLRDYYLVQRILGLSAMALALLIALLLGLTPLGQRLVRRLPGPWWLQTILGTLLVLLMGTVGVLPLRWWMHQRASAHGLTSGGVAQWFQDLSLSFLSTWLITSFVLVLLILVMRRAPKWWPAIAALGAGGLVVLGSFVSPVVMEPLFNDFTTLDDAGLTAQIQELAQAEQVSVSKVLVADASRRTTTLNAYVSGFGATKRVVLYDTLLEDVPRDQVLAVVAHELAHARHGDPFILTALAALGAGIGMGLLPQFLRRSGEQPDALLVPRLLALSMIAGLVVAPIQNGISRSVEARADRDAVLATRDPSAQEMMQIRLVKQSLGDPDPPWLLHFWFGSHPTTVERVWIARSAGD